MMMPLLGIEGGPDGPYQLRVKLALFQNFPYVHEYQTWKILPGAKFLLDATVENLRRRTRFVHCDHQSRSH